MRSLICPMSSLRINGTTVRITGLMMAAMIAIYALTGWIWPIVLITIDYLLRAVASVPYSPFSWLAGQIASGLKLSAHPIDKAPKIFAARVGFLFALATLVLHFINPTAALVVGLILMTFALLEAVFDLCMGCIVYTYLILPAFGRR